MLLYLDSKDLINLIQRNDPMTPADFAHTLQQRNTQLALSWSNVIETVTFRERNIRLTRERAEVLEQLPHRYILGLPPLIRTEFRAAYRSFLANDPQVARVDSLVDEWHQALREPGQRNVLDLYINYGFVDQIVELVFYNSEVGRNTERETNFYKNEVSADRQHAAAVRHSAQWFRAAIFQTLRNTRLFLPHQIFEQFCDFLEANPALCPGWLLFQESYGDFCYNVNDEGQRGDSPDFSHIITAPYVDNITLDRRMAGYARTASQRLSRDTGLATFDAAKILINLAEWL
jgi:hypothetical protein